jgi:hypothetical protein
MNGGRALGIGVACVGAVGLGGCGDGASGPLAGYAVSLEVPDLSTGTTMVSVVVDGEGQDVSNASVSAIADTATTTIWPDGTAVPVDFSNELISRSENNEPRVAGRATWRLTSAADPQPWYSISFPPLPAGYRWRDESELFRLNSGRRGIRISPAHAPVLSGVMVCGKNSDLAALYVRFSEPITATSGAVIATLADTACVLTGQISSEMQFGCPGGDTAAAATIDIVGAIAGSLAGQMVPMGRMQTADMQAVTRLDGCRSYRAIAVP